VLHFKALQSAVAALRPVKGARTAHKRGRVSFGQDFFSPLSTEILWQEFKFWERHIPHPGI